MKRVKSERRECERVKERRPDAKMALPQQLSGVANLAEAALRLDGPLNFTPVLRYPPSFFSHQCLLWNRENAII